jgi:hypothetical protein
MPIGTLVGFVLALGATTLTNLAYLREHDAAATLPALSVRRPLHSLRLLLGNRSWLRGFGMETAGFLLYAAALGLAPLALVQSIGAGGIGVLAYVSARMSGRRPAGLELTGVIVSVLGLVTLAVSLAGGNAKDGTGSTARIILWLGATGAAALLVLLLGRRHLGLAVAMGIAGGLFFSIGDISTKLATQGGARVAFVVTIVLGYMLGTVLLQRGYQAGSALTVAGLAMLLTNALPIAAGAVVLDEGVPSGASGALRVVAFAAVTVGAGLLARPEAGAASRGQAKVTGPMSHGPRGSPAR